MFTTPTRPALFDSRPLPSMADSSDSSPLSSLPSSPSLASSPLSMRSTSPSPPPAFGYPSPSSTQPSESRASSRSRDMPLRETGTEGPPPMKKRKIAEPKKRTTEYLDLRDSALQAGVKPEDEIQLQRLLKALHKKQKIVVIAGAGISVSAGIPDFRSSTGLFNTLKGEHKLKGGSGKQLFDASVYKSDDSTASFHDMVRELSHQTSNAKPTPFHHMLATLAEEGRLLRLYSQNVDGIDTSLPPLSTNVPLNTKGPWPKTIQLHGGLAKMQCTKCRALSDFDGALFEGPEPPPCPECQTADLVRTQHAGKRSHGIGRLRPRMVLYNEYNPDEEAIGAVCAADIKSRPDAVIVVGTSMKIPGLRRLTKEICWVARGRKDGFTAWINLDPEPPGVDFQGCWDLVVRAPCDDIAMYAGLPRWDDKDVGEYKEASAAEVLSAKAKSVVNIALPAHKAVEQVQGMVTPTASPRHQTPIDIKNVTKIQLTLPGLNGNAAKPKKMNTKKVKPSKKTATVQTTKIISSFSMTKPSKSVSTKGPPKDSASEPSPMTYEAASKNLFSYIAKADAAKSVSSAVPMQPLPSTHLRTNIDAPSQLQSEHAKYEAEGLDIERPNSPYKKEYYSVGHKETVSPKSSPRGMAHLLD